MPKVAVQTKITSVQQLRVQYGFLLVVRGGGGPHAGRWYEYLNPLHRDVALWRKRYGERYEEVQQEPHRIVDGNCHKDLLRRDAVVHVNVPHERHVHNDLGRGEKWRQNTGTRVGGRQDASHFVATPTDAQTDDRADGGRANGAARNK